MRFHWCPPGSRGPACHLEARPGLAAAHGHRSLTQQSLRFHWCPPNSRGPARHLEARPGPAAAHGHRSLALRPLRRPPHRRRLRRCVWWSFPSKPGQALPPPMGTAAWPSGALALLFCCLWHRWCSGRRRARPPARSPHTSLRLGVVDLEARPGPPDPPAPSTPAALARLCVASKPGQAPPPPMGTAARLSGPSGTLHAGGAAGICN